MGTSRLSRRRLLQVAAGAAVVPYLFSSPRRAMAVEHKLPELPWARDALAPILSKETLDFHYGKHHQAYVTGSKQC